MDLQEFLAWDAPSELRWQLVDGEPQAMAPANRTHGHIQARLAGLIDAHLTNLGGPCSVIVAPGVVPRVRSDSNFRVPDMAVTCSPCEQEEVMLTDPVLIAEILSPSSLSDLGLRRNYPSQSHRDR